MASSRLHNHLIKEFNMLRTLCTLFVLCTAGICFSQQEQLYSKAKITYHSTDDFNKLIDAGVPMDHGQHKRGVFIISDFSKHEIEIARNLGVQVDILIDDSQKNFLQRNILATNAKGIIDNSCTSTDSHEVSYTSPSNFKLGSMGGYFTYQEVLDNLDSMREKYPSLISKRAAIGNFVTNGTPDSSITPSIGGNTLQWVRISDNPDVDESNEPEILYNAIHHAREPAGLSQLIYFMWYVLENYDRNPEIKNIVDTTALYFVPVVNPDGYLYNQKTNPNGGGLWRKNRSNSYGVDLNRNYDHYTDGSPSSSIWGGEGTSTNTASDVYAGTEPFSEIETQAMKWFIQQHDFVVALNNHTSGDLLLYPYGYAQNKPTPDNSLYKLVSEEMVSQNDFKPMISANLYPAAGDCDDFMYGGTIPPHHKIFAFTPEIGSSFWPASNEIEGICKSMMYLNLTAAKITHNYAQIKNTKVNAIGDSLTFDASFEIRRLGLGGDGNFTVRIIPISKNIASVDTAKKYSNISLGATINDVLRINLKNSITAGEEVVYKIQVDGGLFTPSVTVAHIFGRFQAIINTNGNTLHNYIHSGWDTTSSDFVSPGSSITESPNGNYRANQNKTIELAEAINLKNVTTANVEFYAKWDIEQNWDYAQFEISTDNGISWIPQCGSYTNAGSSNTNQPTQEPLYDGTQKDWVLEQIDLNDYIGKTIKLRFQFASDSATEADGFYFDDLKVNFLNEDILTLEDTKNELFSIFPNPVNNVMRIDPTSLNEYSFIIQNIRGQSILKNDKAIGSQSIDLTALASGVYFISAQIGIMRKTIKVLKL